jgi:hypothetical protein
MFSNLEQILKSQPVKDNFDADYPNGSPEKYRQEIERLFSDWGKHPFDCKCLICR